MSTVGKVSPNCFHICIFIMKDRITAKSNSFEVLGLSILRNPSRLFVVHELVICNYVNILERLNFAHFVCNFIKNTFYTLNMFEVHLNSNLKNLELLAI